MFGKVSYTVHYSQIASYITAAYVWTSDSRFATLILNAPLAWKLLCLNNLKISFERHSLSHAFFRSRQNSNGNDNDHEETEIRLHKRHQGDFREPWGLLDHIGHYELKFSRQPGGRIPWQWVLTALVYELYYLRSALLVAIDASVSALRLAIWCGFQFRNKFQIHNVGSEIPRTASGGVLLLSVNDTARTNDISFFLCQAFILLKINRSLNHLKINYTFDIWTYKYDTNCILLK